MKHLASLLLAATLTTASAYAAPGDNTRSSAAASVEPDGFLRPQSSPTPAGGTTAAAPGPKKPPTGMLAKDDKGKSPTTVFASTDAKIYFVWKDETAAKGDKLRIAWYAEDTGGAISKNKKLTESVQTMPGSGAYGASYLPAAGKGFPAGKYRVELYDGAKLAKREEFTIQK